MFTVHIDTIGHYQCKPSPGWDVLHSSFWSTEVSTVPVLCILGATPTGQKACVHIHGQFPYLLIPISRTKADQSSVHIFAACLEDAITSAASPNTANHHHVFSISLVSRRLKTECKELQQYMKVYFYDPEIVPKAARLLQDGAVMNTHFQPWGADVPFFLQFIIDHHLHDSSHVHFSAFKERSASKKHADETQHVYSVTEGDVCRSAGDLAPVQWRSFREVVSGVGLPQWTTPTPAARALGCHVDNMPSEMLPLACQKPLSLLEVEVDVKAADIIHRHQLHELPELDSVAGLMEESSSTQFLRCAACRRGHQDLTENVPPFSSCPENRHYIIDKQTVPFGFDSDDDCAMDDSDCNEEDEEDDDSDGDIPQLDGTSDEKTATKKPSRKRGSGKNSKLGAGSGGSGREDSSSQGEGSNPSCSPQVQSPVMMPGGEIPFSREQGGMSPYRHPQGSFPYQAGYYRQQWGESSMAPGMTSMSPYPGYPPSSAGWGHSAPPHSAYSFMHRFPGNSFGYYTYPRHHPYGPAFRQTATQSGRQQANFSPPVSSPMSPPSFSASGPSPHSHSNAGSQQYAHFMSPQAAAVQQRHSEGSVAQQDRVFNSSSEWQYPHPAFQSWGFAQGSAQRLPSAPGQSMPPATVHGMPSSSSSSGSAVPPATIHSMSSSSSGPAMPSATVHSMSPASAVPPETVHTISSGSAMPSVPAYSMPSRSAVPPEPSLSMSSGSTVMGDSMPSGQIESRPTGSALSSGYVQTMSSGSVMPTGPGYSMSSAMPVQSMSSGSAGSSGSVQNVSLGSVVSASPAHSLSPESISTGLAQSVPSGPAAVSGANQSIPSRLAVPSQSVPSLSLGSAGTSERRPTGVVENTVTAESSLSGLAENMCLESAQTQPELVQDMSSQSSRSIPVRSEQSVSPQSAQSLSSGSAHNVPTRPGPENASESVHSVSSGPVSNTLTLPAQAKAQEETLHLTQAMGLDSVRDMPSRSVADTPSGSMGVESREGRPSGSAEISQDGPARCAEATSAVSVNSQSGESSVSGLSAVVSRGEEAVSSSVASKAPDTPHNVSFCSTSRISPTSASLSGFPDSSFETSANASASVPLASRQNRFTGSGSDDNPADSSLAASLSSSSAVSFQSSVASSGYSHSGSCPPVSSRSSHAAPVGPYRDMASNWWGAPFAGGPRPMQNSVLSPVGQSQFSPMQGEAMAGQRHHGPGRNHFQTAGGFGQAGAGPGSQTPSGQRQPSPMSGAHSSSGPAQLCGMQSMSDSTGHGQPFPVQQNLTGPRYPGPAHTFHSPVGQRYPSPVNSMHSQFAQRHRVPSQSMHMPVGQRQPGPMHESGYDQLDQGQSPSHSFPPDPNRRPAGPGQNQASSSLPCDRSKWQDCRNAPSTLQDLLSAPDSSSSSSAKPSSHVPSNVTFPRRAMSMDCSPTDFYTSPTRGSESGEAVKQEFKQPQKRSGSFGSPVGFPGSGGGGGGGAPSALSNLFNFVSNVDPMARTPTPTSRNSTPSSTPHSDPSPNLSYRPEEDSGTMEVGLGPVKWQPHLASPHGPQPRSASVDEVFGSQAKQLPPAASPVLGGGNAGPSMSKEQARDNVPQVKQQTEACEENPLPLPIPEGFKTEKRADKEVLMCNKEVGCDNLEMPVQAVHYKGTKKEVAPGNRMAGGGKKESAGTAVSGSARGGRKESSGAATSTSGRAGKQSRVKKVGGGGSVNRGRRMSDDRVKSPPAVPTPCPAYTFTFHVPTPVYKRFKMHAIFPDKTSQPVKLVRMHPMDARRYSLLKIGRELVRVKRLSPQDVKLEGSGVSCADDPASCSEDHNSLIDPHTGELLHPLPTAVTVPLEAGLQSWSHNKDTTAQSGSRHLLGPECGRAAASRLLAEGSCQTSAARKPGAGVGRMMGRTESEQKMYKVPPDPVTTAPPSSLPHQIQNEMGDGSGGNQSWQTLDRDRRPSVKVEYPAQRGSGGGGGGSEQWPCSQPAPPSWAGGSWAYSSSGQGQWGEQWQNSSSQQPATWGPSHGGQAYNYGPWMGGGGGFHHPGASNMYPYNAWSASGHSFNSQPSMSTTHGQPASSGSSSSSSAGQGGMGPMVQSQAYHQGYPHSGSGMYGQQAAFPPNNPNSAGGKYPVSHVGSSSMRAEHYPYHGTPTAQNYMGHNPYHGNYPTSGYQQPAGDGRKAMCQPRFGVGQQQQQQQQQKQQQQQQQQQPVGGMTGVPQENRQYGQCGNPANFERSGGGYSATGPGPNMPSAPPHGPGPGPGSVQFGGQPAHTSPTQQGPFRPASQQQPGHFFQSSQFSHQSGQFSSHTQASNRVPPHTAQTGFSPGDQQGLSGDQQCPASERSSQDGSRQNSEQKDLSHEPVDQKGQHSETPGPQDHQGNKSESDSGCPEVGDSSVGSHDLHTPEHKSFLQQAACQALTTTVCEPSVLSAQNSQSDRPETDISENSTDTIELNTIVQNTISRGYNTQHSEPKCIIFDTSLESAAFQDMEGGSDITNQKKLKGRRCSSSYKDKQQLRTSVNPCSRQSLRRSSVQLWSDGDSDSVEDNSDDESSDDYKPSCRSRRKRRKRKRSRHKSKTETKRTKRSSVNYNAHAFSKYLDHEFEERSSPRPRQSHNLKGKRKRRKRKGSSLVEGVHYIVVGKFKGQRLMLVKLNKIKVKVDERVKVSDWWSRTGEKGQVTTPRRRLQGPRCRRIAKGAPPDDPCFVQPGDGVDTESDRDECEDLAPEEKCVTVASPSASNSNNKVEPATDVKGEEEDCDVKIAIKQETDDTPVDVYVSEGDALHEPSASLTQSEHGAEPAAKGSGDLTESGSVDALSDKTEMEAVVSPQGELAHGVECSDSGIEHEDSTETGDSTERKQCAVKTDTELSEISEKTEQQDEDSADRDNRRDSPPQSASCVGAGVLEEDGEDTVDFSTSGCVHTDNRSFDAESALQGQSPVLLSETGEPAKTMSTAVSLSLLEGKTC